jgi:tRNA threonylcarbamoyladenosine biosynthesis protein TsaE
MRVRLADEAATTALGQTIAPLLRAGDAVLLDGPLGMGKSTLARGLIRALVGGEVDVPSPTFTIVQFYETTPPVAHFDLYRLERPSEAAEIGLDEALDVGVAAIEWPERLGDQPEAGTGPADDPAGRRRRRARCDRFWRRPVGRGDEGDPCPIVKPCGSTS